MAQVEEGIIRDPKLALAYMLQPRRKIVTLRSAKTGVRVTYRIEPQDKEAAKKNGTKDMRYWVKFLFGPNNESDYRYLGQILNGTFSLTRKSREDGFSEQTPAFKAFQWALSGLFAGTMPDGLEVIHSGRCARCGKVLNVPKSVADGFGPECIELVGGGANAYKTPEIAPVKIHTPIAGTPAPQRKLNFAKPAVKTQGTPAVVKPSTFSNVGDIDAEIRRRIATYRSEAPENYYHDGELDDKQAFNVAYNMFRVEIEREIRQEIKA